MSAQDPAGGQKFWFNGLPFNGNAISGRDIGSLKFWFNGLPATSLFPTTFVPPPNPGNSGKGKGGSPGQIKKQELILAGIVHRRKRRKRRDYEADATSFIPQQYLSPIAGSTTRGLEAIDWRQSTRRITISPSGHIVRN